MTWFRVDDRFHAHPKAEAAGLAALGLWTVCGSYLGSFESQSGEISRAEVAARARLLGEKWEPAAAKLVAAGLWDATETGFRFHNWPDYLAGADHEAIRRRKKDAERKRIERSRPRTSTDASTDTVQARPRTLSNPPSDPSDARLPTVPIQPNPTQRESARTDEPMSPGGRVILAELQKHPSLEAVATVAMADALSAPLVGGRVKVEWIATAIAECAAKVAARVAAGDVLTASQLGERLAAFASKARAPEAPRTNGAPKSRAATQPVPPDTEEFAWQHR